MASSSSSAIFSSLRRQTFPTKEAFLIPTNITDVTLFQTLRTISTELTSSSFLPKTTSFNSKNTRSLIRKLQIISLLLDADFKFPKIAPTISLCLNELYLLFHRAKILLTYVQSSSKLWLLIQNRKISGYFHDINNDISSLLDVFPLNHFVSSLSLDIIEQINLLINQTTRCNNNNNNYSYISSSDYFVDNNSEHLRLKLYYLLNEFANGRIPDKDELHCFFVEKLGITSVREFRDEIEYLEEQIVNQDTIIEPCVSIINGFIALIRYSRFTLFRFEDEEGELGKLRRRNTKKGVLISKDIGESFVTVPKDFCCPISLELMYDPVIVSTGQSYERVSIARWIEEGHCSCPKTGQMLVHTKLVPNRALRNLIGEWCLVNGISYDLPENSDYSSESVVFGLPSKAAIEATKATAGLLVEELRSGSERAKTVAAREIRLLAKTGKANRACIAEAGAIPLLKILLTSSNAFAQENSVTAMLNLSIYDKNKSRIMDVEGCLGSIVEVLQYGQTTEARENAAATLFSLSAVHDYKKQIAEENGAVEALAALLRDGTCRGKKDAVTALFNLSTHNENCGRMIESGAITALIGALGCEGVAEEAAGALALIVRQPMGAEAVGKEETAVVGLIGMMRCGTPKGKENAVAALLELCRSGGAAATERVVKAPALVGLLQSLLFTGTKRARRKAASLARVFQRCESASLHYGGLGVGYVFAGNSGAPRDTSFGGDVSMQVSISVPVL